MTLHAPQKRRWLSGFFRSWGQLRRFRRLTADRRSIVFYSESGQDWHHFRPILDHLTHRLGRTVCYVTSDPSDPGLSQENGHLLSFCILPGFWQIAFFQFLKADVMVLTMIDLHVFQLKRSINPVHYVYLFHSMSSTHMVDFENSYDHYDTIFCVGPHQVREIRRREELKKLPAKNLFEHGYARIERLMAEAAGWTGPARPPGDAPTVLLAPTWGENSILPICGPKLVDVLLDAGFRLILRPHYQTIALAPHVVDPILSKHGSSPMFTYVNTMADTQSLFESDLLICDWSSTSIEYALGLAKPVLYIDVPKRARNPKYEELGIEPIEIGIRSRAGTVLPVAEIDRAPAVIWALLSEPDRFRQRIVELRKELLFNLGRSVEAGAAEIARIADGIRHAAGTARP